MKIRWIDGWIEEKNEEIKAERQKEDIRIGQNEIREYIKRIWKNKDLKNSREGS